MPNKTYRRMVSLPPRVAEHMDRVRTRMIRAHLNGQYNIPDKMADSCPRWYVLERALDGVDVELDYAEGIREIEQSLDSMREGKGKPMREGLERLARENGFKLE